MSYVDIIAAIILIAVLVTLERMAKRKRINSVQPQTVDNKINEIAQAEQSQRTEVAKNKALATIRENMKRRLCIAKVVASSVSSTESGSKTTHCCSVAGNEALIAWIDFPNLMSPRSTFLKHEIVDLITGERKDIVIGEEGALLTTSYIVTGFAENYTSGVVYCKNRLQIIDRKTNEKREVELKDYPANKFGLMQVNDKKEYNTVAISSNTKFFVVDLKDGSCKTFAMSSAFGYQDFIYKMKFQLCGKYLAYSSTELDANVSSDKFRLEVVDTQTGQICFTEGSGEFNVWSVDGDKILLASVTQTKGLKWKLYDFRAEKVLSEYNLSEKSGTASSQNVLAKLNDGIIAIAHQSQFHFFDAINGELLSRVSLLGNWPPEFAYHQIFTIGAGKFVYCQRFNTRIFDFESSAISKQISVKVQRVPQKSKPGVAKKTKETPDENISVEFGNLTSIACQKLSALPSELMAINVRDKLKTGDQLVTIIFSNNKATEEVSTAASLSEWKPNLNLDLLLPEFTDGANSVRSSEMKQMDEIRGSVILVKEKLKNRKWRPIDYE